MYQIFSEILTKRGDKTEQTPYQPTGRQLKKSKLMMLFVTVFVQKLAPKR